LLLKLLMSLPNAEGETVNVFPLNGIDTTSVAVTGHAVVVHSST
jgi:hypothetical protein